MTELKLVENVNGFNNPPVLNGIESNSKAALKEQEVDKVGCGADEVDKNELVRLIGQSLHSLGYLKTLECLEGETGIDLNERLAKEFKLSICQGSWDEAIGYLSQLIPAESTKSALFTIYKQIFLELILSGKSIDAVLLLRDKMVPNCDCHFELQNLSALLLCTKPDDLLKAANWPGPFEGRRQLIKEIQQMAYPDKMMPENRLVCLLMKALPPKTNSLLRDSKTHDDEHLNLKLLKTVCLESEVWDVAVTTNGTWAAGCQSGKVFIGKFGNEEVIELNGHKGAVTSVKFSPDEAKLLSCSLDQTGIIWDLQSMNSICSLKAHTWPITAGDWLDNYQVVTAGEDVRMIVWNVKGQIVQTFSQRVTSLAAVSPNLICCASQNAVCLFDLKRGMIWEKGFNELVSSVHLKSDDQAGSTGILAVDLDKEIQMFDVRTGGKLMHLISCQTAPMTVNKSCSFGDYVARGSPSGILVG